MERETKSSILTLMQRMQRAAFNVVMPLEAAGRMPASLFAKCTQFKFERCVFFLEFQKLSQQ